MRKFSVLATVLAVGLATCGLRHQNQRKWRVFLRYCHWQGRPIPGRGPTRSPATGRFELINVNGRITAEPTDGAEIVVEGRRTAKARSDEAAKELLAKLEIREEVGESTVRVESRPPRLSGFSGHEIEWTIKVPEGRHPSTCAPPTAACGSTACRRHSRQDHQWRRQGHRTSFPASSKRPRSTAASSSSSPRRSRPAIPIADGDRQWRRRAGAAAGKQGQHRRRAASTAACTSTVSTSAGRRRSQNDFERRRRLNGDMNGGGARVDAEHDQRRRPPSSSGKKTT